MDRLAAHVIATAALTVTLATVPVLFADACHAATAPASATAPLPQSSNDARTTGAAALPALPPLAAQAAAYQTAQAKTAAPAAGAAGTAAAKKPRLLFSGGPCADVHQVGQTVHEIYHGIAAFSVKEFYSPGCHSYYGYSFAWLQFRRLHVHFDVGMAVYDATHDAIDGARTYIGGAGGPDYWSAPVSAVKGVCTQGEGHYFYYPPNSPAGFEEGDMLSTKVCA